MDASLELTLTCETIARLGDPTQEPQDVMDRLVENYKQEDALRIYTHAAVQILKAKVALAALSRQSPGACAKSDP